MYIPLSFHSFWAENSILFILMVCQRKIYAKKTKNMFVKREK